MNLIFIAEGDEERMDIGLRKFVKDHPDLVRARRHADVRRIRRPAAPAASWAARKAAFTSNSPPVARSGAAGPVDSDIHGSNKRAVDSPAWRHIKMLASLVSDDGNTPMIQGLFRQH